MRGQSARLLIEEDLRLGYATRGHRAHRLQAEANLDAHFECMKKLCKAEDGSGDRVIQWHYMYSGPYFVYILICSRRSLYTVAQNKISALSVEKELTEMMLQQLAWGL